MIAADTIGFVIPVVTAEKQRRFKMNSSISKHQMQLKSDFLGIFSRHVAGLSKSP
jgi:hypothetical protein